MGSGENRHVGSRPTETSEGFKANAVGVFPKLVRKTGFRDASHAFEKKLKKGLTADGNEDAVAWRKIPFLVVSKAVAVLESLESWNSRSVRKQGALRLAVTEPAALRN